MALYVRRPLLHHPRRAMLAGICAALAGYECDLTRGRLANLATGERQWTRRCTAPATMRGRGLRRGASLVAAHLLGRLRQVIALGHGGVGKSPVHLVE